MSRAIRRQQAAGPKEGAPAKNRPVRLGPGPRQPSRGARPPAQARRRFRFGWPGWLVEIVSELKKVTWPTMAETRHLTLVVIVVSVIVGMALGGIDLFFNWLIDRLLLR